MKTYILALGVMLTVGVVTFSTLDDWHQLNDRSIIIAELSSQNEVLRESNKVLKEKLLVANESNLWLNEKLLVANETNLVLNEKLLIANESIFDKATNKWNDLTITKDMKQAWDKSKVTKDIKQAWDKSKVTEDTVKTVKAWWSDDDERRL